MVRKLLDGDAEISMVKLIKHQIDNNLFVSQPNIATTASNDPIDGCSYCGASGLSSKQAVPHRLECQKQETVAEWIAHSPLIAHMRSLTSCPMHLQQESCANVSYGDVLDLAHHLEAYIKNPTRPYCPFPGCDVELPCTQLRIHVEQAHRLISATQRYDTLEQLYASITKYCYFCRIPIPTKSAWRLHCQQHLDDITQQDNVVTLLTQGATIVRPGLCPWCIKDPQAMPEDAMHMFTAASSFYMHLERHLLDLLDDATSDLACPAPHCQLTTNRSVRDLGNQPG